MLQDQFSVFLGGLGVVVEPEHSLPPTLVRSRTWDTPGEQFPDNLSERIPCFMHLIVECYPRSGFIVMFEDYQECAPETYFTSAADVEEVAFIQAAFL